ncbi:MAG: fumarate hydratase [Hyphomonadaceae bacterium]|nr:fumarate hydratase [Clostridia bacterium]
MRIIACEEIIKAVRDLCIQANVHIGQDVIAGMDKAILKEQSPLACEILSQLKDNAKLAASKQMPICQDTGMAVVFFEIGQNVSVVDGSIEKAIHEGVRQGYRKGYFRASVVSDPLQRKNTGDNTPAVIHYDIIEGDNIHITVAPKGFGSENMSGVKMLKPSDGVEGVKKFVIDVIDLAGGNPCPPMVVGVGIGGTMEKAAFLAKKALLRPVGSTHPDPYYQDLEVELLNKANQTGIGPQGLGGTTTALALHIDSYPTHIAGLPVAVNISCHVTRHAYTIL